MSSRDTINNVRERVGVCEVRIESQRLEISELRGTVRKIQMQGIGEESGFESETSSYDDVDAEIQGESGGPLWDRQDAVFRCPSCGWEIVDSSCQGCYTEFQCSEEHGKPSAWTPPDALHSDRSRTRRGTTPTIDVRHLSVSPAYATSPGILGRSQEYYALLSRGANRLMCETFNLEYTDDGGIFAWADGTLYKQFSGPAMKVGDFWKIYLGRRVELDEHDLDGSLFIEGLLEDVLLYPLRSSLSDRVSERWETVEESPGIWVTRPMVEVAKDLEMEDLSSDYDDYEDSEKGSENSPEKGLENSQEKGLEKQSETKAKNIGFLGRAAENTRLAKMEDEALVVPRENTGPVAQVDPGYIASDEEDAEEEDVNMSDDLGFCFVAGVPDREWEEDSDSEESTDDEYDSDE